MFLATTAESRDAVQFGGAETYGVNPAWAPDGSALAFGGRTGEGTGLHVMNVDGSNVRLLLAGGLERFSFFAQDWSPDGKQIATQGGGHPNEIWVIEANGSGEVNVSNHDGNDGGPRWSPDGGSLLWGRGSRPTGDATEEHSIVLMVGTEPRPVGPKFQGGEFWSPDGMMLVGLNGDQPSDGLFILDSESGEIVAEIPTPDPVDRPSWQRLAP